MTIEHIKYIAQGCCRRIANISQTYKRNNKLFEIYKCKKCNKEVKFITIF